MNITILQTDIQWGCPEENIKQAESLLLSHPGSDLYVLPEMWSTGFATEPQGLAEDENNSISLAWMKQTAQQQNCAICGSLAVRTADGNYRNRQYFVNGRNGTVQYYDTHHLFT